MYQRLAIDRRILHCPDNIGNNAKCLSDYEKKLGYKSTSISLRKESYGFTADRTLVSSGSFILGEIARWRLLLIAIFQFDVVHFNNGKTIMPHRVPFASVRQRTNLIVAGLYVIYAWLFEGLDLPVLRFFGKRFYFTFQGSDARLSSHFTQIHSPEVLSDLNPDYLSPTADRFKRKRIRRAEKYAEQIYCLNPDLLVNFSAKAKFMPYYNIDLNSIEPHPIFDREAIHIVHAPSKRNIKGSRYVIAAIKKIQQQIPNIRFTLVENMSNHEAQKVYDTADLFIDQLIVGWYGGVAVELMARGVPVICFISNVSRANEKTGLLDELPIIDSSIVTLENDLRVLLAGGSKELQILGQKSRKFVQSRHRIGAN